MLTKTKMQERQDLKDVYKRQILFLHVSYFLSSPRQQGLQSLCVLSYRD